MKSDDIDRIIEGMTTNKNSLRQAAERALGYFEDAYGLEDAEVAIKEALRQALNVDAVNMSQEHVDETAKGEQEPFIYVREDNEKPFGGYEHCSEADAGAFPVYLAPPKRDSSSWVGLTDEVKTNWKALGLVGVEIVAAHLKEKNT